MGRDRHRGELISLPPAAVRAYATRSAVLGDCLCFLLGDAIRMPHWAFVDFPSTDKRQAVALIAIPLLEGVGETPGHVVLEDSTTTCTHCPQWCYYAHEPPVHCAPRAEVALEPTCTVGIKLVQGCMTCRRGLRWHWVEGETLNTTASTTPKTSSRLSSFALCDRVQKSTGCA